MKEEKTGKNGVKVERQHAVDSAVETVIRNTDAAYRHWLTPFWNKLLAASVLLWLVVSLMSYSLMPDLGYSYIKAGKDNTRYEVFGSVQSIFGRQ